MSELTVLILSGRAPRHLYVTNRLCKAATPLAIVQKTGREWTVRNVSRALRPANIWSKASRQLRDCMHGRGGEEAKFFFGNAEPALIRPDLVVEVPYVYHPKVTALVDHLKPDIRCRIWHWSYPRAAAQGRTARHH